jgi:hypothetical protein
VGALWMLGGLDYAAVTKNWWATTRLLWFIIYSHSASGLYRLLPSSPASSTVNHCVHGDGHAHNQNRLNRTITPVSLITNSLCPPSVVALC